MRLAYQSQFRYGGFRKEEFESLTEAFDLVALARIRSPAGWSPCHLWRYLRHAHLVRNAAKNSCHVVLLMLVLVVGREEF